MKSLEELRQFYHSNLLPQLEELEHLRKESVQKLLLAMTVIVVLTVILVAITLRMEDLFMYVLFLGFIAAGIAYKTCTGKYVANFKADIIEQIVTFIQPGLEYSQDGYIPFDLFKKSELFLSDIDVYKGEDMVMGKVDATEFGFSEVHAQDERRGDKGRRYYVTIFKGLFFVADFNKHFKGRTFVLPDKAEKALGGIGKMFQKINISRPQVVRLEDPDFERAFVVYGTDQTEARYILSPSLMRRILDFKNKSGQTIHLSFIDSSVHIAINLRKNLFEPKIFETILNFEPIREYYQDLELAIGIIEDLNLNTRIWTKA